MMTFCYLMIQRDDIQIAGKDVIVSNYPKTLVGFRLSLPNGHEALRGVSPEGVYF